MRVYPYIVFITGFAHLALVFLLINRLPIQKVQSETLDKISIQLQYTEKPVPIPEEFVEVPEFPEIQEIEDIQISEPEPMVEKPEVQPVSKPIVKETIQKPSLEPRPQPESKPLVKMTNKKISAETQIKPIKRSEIEVRREQIRQALGLKKEYDQLLKTYLEKRKRFPTLARRFNQQGVAKYKIRIEKDGTFSNIKRLESTGFESLDNESMKLIQSASGFKPIPRQFSFLNLTIPIEYSLQ